MARKTKYIVITGGVLSGLGKGIATASIGHLLGSKLRIIPIKCDGYLNTDPGTMNPIEHGEVFVLDDGGEVDMDFGHYERFLGVTCKFEWNLTMGKVYQSILDKERRGDYLGRTVQLIPHVTDEIISWFHNIADNEKADICLIEIGGTMGDIENELYIEAVRQLAQEEGKENVVFVHLTYVPLPSNVGEQKSKPTQQSVKLLNERGIFPDVIIGRSKKPLEPEIKQKISRFCNVPIEAVISGEDVRTVYEIPLRYDDDGLTEILHKRLNIYSPPRYDNWRKLVENILKPKDEVNIAICGKYTRLHDSYASIIEALTHAGAHNDTRIKITWLETSRIETGKTTAESALDGIDGVIVPGGFGTRGIEGKIEVIRHCREKEIPFLGICYGMQLAVVEFARNVCGIESANTTEITEDGGEVEQGVICILPSQQNITRKGGTMRLGGQNVSIKSKTRTREIYGKSEIRERFRHRYEVNPEFVSRLEECGLVFSGTTPEGDIMQIMELPEHPFFFGTQYH
ncbi:MAG TPA: CTP synthase (glutamine hydrolyzing), partial [candidate division Zixibacteria bacterium]|nr:CTP synthase (glutamine hydrolyzing) [candidate division Zixibacteria bacterium]